MAVFGFGCTYARTKVALCLPGLTYQPVYWFTRYKTKRLKYSNIYWTPNLQVPPASVPMAESYNVDDPHLLGLDPGLPGHSGAVLQCRQSGGQEVDGDEAEGGRNRFVAFQVNFIL